MRERFGGLWIHGIHRSVCWLGLWQFRRLTRVPSWNLAVILVLTLVTLGLMTRASNFGGEIRHAEIRASQGIVTSEGDSEAVWHVPWARSLPTSDGCGRLAKPSISLA